VTAYRSYVNRLLRSNFKKFVLINKVPEINKSLGLIVTPNHFSWWDGFFTDYTMRSFCNRKLYIMMLEEQLRKYWFFRYTGAFSISNGSPGATGKSMNYAKNIARSQKDYLIFYPQGEIQNYNKEYVSLKKGIAMICKDIEGQILILSFKIVFSHEKKPTVFCRFGEILSSSQVAENFSLYEKSFKNNLELLDVETTDNISLKGKDIFSK